MDTIRTDGERIFFHIEEDHDVYYSIKTDGTDKQKINEEISWVMISSDGWLYYPYDINTDCLLYRIRYDGTGKQRLTNKYTEIYAVIDGWIYYKLAADDNHIHRMKTNGTDEYEYTDAQADYITFYEDRIFYKEITDNGHLYSMKTDGTDIKKLNDLRTWKIFIINDTIFFNTVTEESCFYSISTDGTNLQKIADFNAELYLECDDGFFCQVIIDHKTNLFYYDFNTGKLKKIGPFFEKTFYNPDLPDTSEYATDGLFEGGCPIGQIGDWFVYLDTGYMLCKVKVDGSEKTKICDDRMTNTKPIIINDCIYYINPSDRNKLYSIRIDGTGKKKIYDKQIYMTRIETDGERIFFHTAEDKLYAIYSIKTDGTDLQKINKEIMPAVFSDGWIYYTDDFTEGDQECVLFKIRYDGTEEQQLTDVYTGIYSVIDGWIYYRTAYHYDSIFRMKTDGTKEHEFADVIASSVRFCEDRIVYTSETDDCLYSMKTDGTDIKKISDLQTWTIFTFNDTIFFITTATEGSCFYSISPDGTNLQKIADFYVSLYLECDDSFFCVVTTDGKVSLHYYDFNTGKLQEIGSFYDRSYDVATPAGV